MLCYFFLSSSEFLWELKLEPEGLEFGVWVPELTPEFGWDLFDNFRCVSILEMEFKFDAFLKMGEPKEVWLEGEGDKAGDTGDLGLEPMELTDTGLEGLDFLNFRDPGKNFLELLESWEPLDESVAG